MKKCPICNITKERSEFYTRRGETRTGQSAGYCIKCSIKLSTARVSQKRRDIKLAAVKESGGKCQLCSFNSSVWALSFHHLNPKQKDFGISQMKNLKKALIEAAKCYLVCGNCHMEIHEGLYPSVFKKPPMVNNHSTRHRTKRMLDYIHYLGGQCKDCSYSKCSRALNFHHLGGKELGIGGMSFLPKLEEMQSELDKCILLCSNCHQIRHEKENKLSL